MSIDLCVHEPLTGQHGSQALLDFPGAFFHVIVRGNQRATIFHDAADYTAYLDRLDRYRRRDGVTLHASVLMNNHVHLLLATGLKPLSRTMHTLNTHVNT